VISVSKLLCGAAAEGDGLRYGDPSNAEGIRQRRQERPVVVWNATKRCNLACVHCYAGAETERAPGELSTAEAKGLLDDLADYGVPVVLFSGGEPLVREDLVELVAYADGVGLRPVLSTNGTLVTEERARELKEAGLAYAGVSVDLLTDEGVDRFCFYHLDYGGRGGEIVDVDLDPEARREAVRTVCELTRDYHARGEEIETLLVGNYADAAYLVEYARRELGETVAREVERYLRVNGGDPAGERVADVDYQGNVHPTQFWQGYSLGNVRDRPFGAIWDDESNPLVRAVRERPDNLEGRCADCQYVDLCRGGSRLRALAVEDDLFAPDPQCYLTPAERGVDDGGHGDGSDPAAAD
jgi:radical SAM protein with 4Fe4S-binding SPASM domain